MFDGRAVIRLLIGFAIGLAVWFLFKPGYEKAVAPGAEFLIRLGESPAVTRLDAPGGKFILTRTDAPAGSELDLPAPDLHFNFVLLVAFFALHPHPWRGNRLARLLVALVCLYLVHVVFLVFQVQSVYATSLGDWSAAHYGKLARNFWAAGFHFYQIAGRFAAPFAIWWLIGRAEPIPAEVAVRGPRRKKKRKG